MSKHNTDSIHQPAETLIVGGSLGGLTTALSLSKQGRASIVLERTQGRTQRGVAIRASGRSLKRVLDPDAYEIVEHVLGTGSLLQATYPQAWWDIYVALRQAADADPRITIVEDARVTAVDQDESKAWATTADGQTWPADAVLGADGYRSTVRRYVDAANPTARYAGYVVWLGQSELPAEYVNRVGGPDFVMQGNDLLGTYPLIDRDGSLRRFGFGWFDPSHDKMLRTIGSVRDGEVQHTPRPTDIPDETYEAMIRRASRWEEPWRTGVIEALRARDVVATPISEYLPQRVANGRIAVLGDAAHVQTPMTGSGFEEALEDAVALGQLLPGTDPDSVADALTTYEALRLTDMQRRVAGGQSFSRSFAAA